MKTSRVIGDNLYFSSIRTRPPELGFSYSPVVSIIAFAVAAPKPSVPSAYTPLI